MTTQIMIAICTGILVGEFLGKIITLVAEIVIAKIHKDKTNEDTIH